MKITICGSMHFAKEMLAVQKQLEELGHEAIVPIDVLDCLKDPSLNESMEHCFLMAILIKIISIKLLPAMLSWY